MSTGSANIALLIDGDNVSPKIISGLMAEIANYGTASVRRIYGDWTQPNLGGWKACLLSHSITPMQQPAYTAGKNATDGAMIIDAMDLLYTGRFSSFCIVSSDSDFTRLATRIREQGVTVYGFGERKTHYAFIAACDKFLYFDALDAQSPTAITTEDSAVSRSEERLLTSPALDGSFPVAIPTGLRLSMRPQITVPPQPIRQQLDPAAMNGLVLR